MARKPENADVNQNGRFQPGQSGNPAGKPKGARHRLTLLAEKLMDDEAEDVVRAVVDAAKKGDMTAARLVLERVSPPRKGRTVAFDLPAVATPEDVLSALGAVLAAVSEGTLTPDEAGSVAALLEMKRKAIETVEIEQRLSALESKENRK
jgi:hypothetical protein